MVNITSAVDVAQITLNDSCCFQYDYILKTTAVQITSCDGNGTGMYGPYFNRYATADGAKNGTNVVETAITIRSISWTNTTFVLAATIYDNNTVPVAYSLTSQVLQANSNQIGNVNCSNSSVYNTGNELKLPSFAYVGPAKLYVNIYNENPYDLGLPYCPESSANLAIEAFPIPTH